MPRPRPTQVAFAVLALLLVAVTGPVPAGARTERSPAPAPAVVRDDPGTPRLLHDDVVRPAARPGVAPRIRKWPGSRIPYHETIPRKWQWSLDRAIDHWNSSGGDIRFVKVPRRKAKLVIRYGDTYGAEGIATLGYQHTNFVHLGRHYKRVDAHDPEQRVWVGVLFAHELGHVLGFDHFGPQCTLMHPVFYFGVCDLLVEDRPGWYHCRWIDKPLLRRFIRMYGGSPERPPRRCLIEKLPPQLTNVAFSGGGDQPVRARWDVGRVRAGTRVRIAVWQGGTECSADGGGTQGFYDQTADPSAGSWTDAGYGQGPWCYRLWIENRYGAARPPFTDRRTRYAPVPATPVVAAPVWRPGAMAWRFSWQAPAGTALAVLTDRADPGVCPTVYDPTLVEPLYPNAARDAWDLYPSSPTQCVKVLAVADWGTVSPPGEPRVLETPRPSTPTVSNGAWDADWFGWRFTSDAWQSGNEIVLMRDWANPGRCVTTYDESAAEWQWDEGGGVFHVGSSGEPECLVFFARAPWGAVSDPVVRQQVPPAP